MATFSAICSLDTEKEHYVPHQHTSNQKFLVGCVVSAIAHIVFLMFVDIPSGRTGVERSPAKSIQFKLVARADRSREVPDPAESRDRVSESHRKHQEPENERPENPAPFPAVDNTNDKTPPTDEPAAEGPTPNIVNQLQRYRWGEEAPVIDLWNDTHTDGLPLKRVWGAPLGKENPIPLPFDQSPMNLDDQTPCEKMNDRVQADLELAPDATLPDYREMQAAGLSVLKAMTIIGCGVRSINR